MDRLPPRWIRRLILAPLVFVLCLALIAVSPVVLIVAAIADIFVPGTFRTLRVVAFAVFYLVMEVVGLVAMLVLWIRFGLGTRLKTERAIESHYRFMTWWLLVMYRTISKLLGLRINIEERPEPQPGPLLVFCRHAGPGNSLMLIGTMMIAYGRRPRIVMLAKLQWDPLFDSMAIGCRTSSSRTTRRTATATSPRSGNSPPDCEIRMRSCYSPRARTSPSAFV